MLIRNILKFALALLVVVIGYNYANQMQWDIGAVDIDKVGENISEAEVGGIINPYLDQGWIHLDIVGLKNELFSLAWVEDIKISRVFPDKIHIHLVEKVPVARLTHGKLLSLKGAIFSPPDLAEYTNLPVIEVEEGNIDYAFQAFLVLRDSLKKVDFLPQNISYFRYKVGFGWDVGFVGGLTVHLGRGDFTALFTKFSHYYPDIVRQRNGSIPKMFDMRYSSGAAVS